MGDYHLDGSCHAAVCFQLVSSHKVLPYHRKHLSNAVNVISSSQHHFLDELISLASGERRLTFRRCSACDTLMA